MAKKLVGNDPDQVPTNGDLGTLAYQDSDNVHVGELLADGNITAFSDQSLKTDVETVEDALALVKAMRGVYYTRTDDTAKGRLVGVIAQEMNQVLPEVVFKQGNKLSVDYGNIVAVLIEAIKELKSELDELKKTTRGI